MTLNYRKIILWTALAVLIIAVGAWLTYRFTVEKSLRLTSPSPKGAEVLKANENFKITWKSRNISRVGIILLKGTQGQDVKWIAQDVPARKGSYDWNIFVWEEPREDYKIAVFEYPWQEGNLIDRSDDFFTILGPNFASCDSLSIEAEWPFVPSDFPNLRKVFITSREYTGNLERLEGADQRCQQEAKEKGYTSATSTTATSTWKAFLGDDTNFAVDRLKLEGIFVTAEATGTLPENKTCHRLLGNNFNDFLKKLSDALSLNSGKFKDTFLEDIQNVWLGRITRESLRECTLITFKQFSPHQLERNYSFTTTCQNWTIGLENAPGYPPSIGQEQEFPACFTPAGVRTSAVGLAGLSSGVAAGFQGPALTTSLGKSCNVEQKLLCVQQ